MGCFDIYCFICGNTYRNSVDNFSEIVDGNKIYKKMDWLKNCSVLLKNDEVKHNCTNTDCAIMFETNKDKCKFEAYDINTNCYNFKLDFFSICNQGIFLHTDCWEFVKKNYKIELKYSNIPFELFTKNKIKYPYIGGYWEQDTNYLQMYNDNNIWMALSPLEANKKNTSRIKKIISQFKFKTDQRKGPQISATLCENNSIRLGNNGKFWIKNKGKWNEIKEDVIEKTISMDKKYPFINKISQIGESNTIPLFIKNILFNKKLTIKFIGTNKTIKELEKKL